jgi:cell division septum initiation protein DivIVA
MTIQDEQAAPEFAIAMRGYDRLQVDEYVTQLNAWVAEAEARQSMAESFVADRDRHVEKLQKRIAELEAQLETTTPVAALDDAHTRISESFDRVMASCADLHAKAQARYDEILEGARRDAVAVVNVARASVVELEAEARAIIDEADEYRRTAHSDVERLRSEHQRVLDQLTQLRGSLEGLISAPAAVLAAVDDITGHRDGASDNGNGKGPE